MDRASVMFHKVAPPLGHAARAYYMGKRRRIVKAGIVARLHAIVHKQDEARISSALVPIVSSARFVTRIANERLDLLRIEPKVVPRC